MEPEIQQPTKFESLTKVTPISKYLALTLFVLLPFIGGWIGYSYAPEKTVVIERIVSAEPTDNTAMEVTDGFSYHDDGSVTASLSNGTVVSIAPEDSRTTFTNANVSPDNSWVYVESQPDPHGGKYRWVYDVAEETLHGVQFQDDEEQYKLVDPLDTQFDLHYLSFTTCPGWSIATIPATRAKETSLVCQLESGNIMPESGMGYVIYYTSISTSTPWILVPDVKE